VETWKQYFDASVAVGTVLAVAVAIWQLRSNRRVACEDFARQLWLDYLKIGLENPELGETRCVLAAYPDLTPKDLVTGNHIGSQRYLWFLTVLLDTCENVLRYLQRSDWERGVVEQLRFHRPALKEMWPDEQEFYSDRLARMVQKALAMPFDHDEVGPVAGVKEHMEARFGEAADNARSSGKRRAARKSLRQH
jgi:hypothetical protein